MRGVEGPGAESAARSRGAGRKDALALFGLAALIFLPFAWRWWVGLSALSAPLTHDIGFQWLPFRAFIRDSLRSGVFPLWAPQVFAGFPFAAFSHTGVFYPPGLLLLLGDYAKMVNLYYPLHLIIAGFGVYALARRIGLGPAAAFAAALGYVFTGKPFHFIHFLPATQSNAWMPWLLLAVFELATAPRLGAALLAAAALALAVLGGDVESTAYGLLFAVPGLYILLRERGTPIRRLLYALPPLALGGLLCAVQLGPLLELSHHFIRNQGVTFAYFSQRQLPLALGLGLVAPVGGIEGFPLEAPYFYLGMVTAELAVFAALTSAERSSGRLLTLAALVFLWSFGSVPLLDRLAYRLPLLNHFGSPEQAFSLGQLYLALAAGQGLERLGKLGRESARKAALICLGGGGAAAALGAWREFLPGGWLIPLLLLAVGALAAGWERLRPRRVFPAVLALLLLQAVDVYGLALRYLPANDPARFQTPAWLTRLAANVRASGGRAIMVSRLGLSDPDLLYHAGLALDLDTIDGWITVPLRRYAELLALADPRAAEFKHGQLHHLGINADLRDGRFIDARAMPILDLLSLRFVIDRGLALKFSSPYFLNLAPPDFHRRTAVGGAADRVALREDALAAGPNELYRFRFYTQKGDALRFLALAYHGAGRGPAELALAVEARPAGGAVRVLYRTRLATLPGSPGLPEVEALEGVPVTIDLAPLAGSEIELRLLTGGPVERPDLALLWVAPQVVNPGKVFQLAGKAGPAVLVYENREALPRAFVVEDWETLAPEAVKARLSAASAYELSRRVWLERAPAGMAPRPGAKPGRKAELVRRRPGEEVWRVAVSRPGLLFIADQYYSGWRALVEGREEPVLRADYALRAVPVRPGDGLVRLVFAPASFRVGLWVSLASVVALLPAGIMAARRRKRQAG
jgi:hypothetical protein